MASEAAKVPDVVFRVVLPLLWLLLILGVAANRWRISRQRGVDPIVIRPWRKADNPAAYLERALSICALAVTADVTLNAISPGVVADMVGIKALRTSTAVGFVGLALVASGVLLAAVAVVQMGISWRIGIDHRTPGPLASRGLFARVRHPIYGGMLLAAAGLAGVTADLLSVSVVAAAAVGLPVQARLEEAFLLSRYPQEYPSYLERTGRFWPRILRRSRTEKAAVRQVADGPRLPFPEERIFDVARTQLASQGWKLGNREVARDVPLRVDECVAIRRAADRSIVAYRMTVLIDASLGVPCDSPDSEPRWGSSTVLYMFLDENGEVPLHEQLP